MSYRPRHLTFSVGNAPTRPLRPASTAGWLLASLLLPSLSHAADVCAAQSGERLLPVVELYTSEGCSSCPPADQWLAKLKGKPVLAQAFHVSYWDYIGWVDRFASPANNARQRDLAAANGLSGIYTPQLLVNGRDTRSYQIAPSSYPLARAQLSVQRVGQGDTFEAVVTPAPGVAQWSAYWSVTENGHSSRVKAGENSGATLQHDFVVRQWQTAGSFAGTQTLRFTALPADPQHPRHVNLVVSEPRTQAPLQSISLACE